MLFQLGNKQQCANFRGRQMVVHKWTMNEKKNEKKKICGQLNQKLPAGMYTNGWQPVSDFAFPPTPNHLVLFDKWFDLADIHLFYSVHCIIHLFNALCYNNTTKNMYTTDKCSLTEEKKMHRHTQNKNSSKTKTKKQQHNDNEERVVSMGFCAAQAKCNSYPQVQLCSWLYNYKVYLSVLKMLIMESSLTDLILSTLFWTI